MALPASTRTFATFDLLEDILLHLPLPDLLLTQGVCKQWQGMQQTSVRVRKALFLEPFHSQKVYYPSTSTPHWYLVPGRTELELQGFLSDDDSDDEGFAPSEHKNVSYSVAPTPNQTRIQGSGSSDESSGSGGSDVTICNVTMDKHYMRRTAAAKQQNVLGSSLLHDHDAVKPVIPKDPPVDKKMSVSRIASGPFLNPFAELFLRRYWLGSRGKYKPRPDSVYLNPQYAEQRELVLVPPKRYENGMIHGASHRTHNVQRLDASWRQMAPFSATTTSIQVECFDFGFLEIYEDEGLTAGDMMDQLGKHWGNDCPDCCIFDYWFAEFVQYCCYTDQSYMNRGEHGVRKLGLDCTGWDALSAMYEHDTVRVTGVKDRHRPY